MAEGFDAAEARRAVEDARALLMELLPDPDSEHFDRRLDEIAARMENDPVALAAVRGETARRADVYDHLRACFLWARTSLDRGDAQGVATAVKAIRAFLVEEFQRREVGV